MLLALAGGVTAAAVLAAPADARDDYPRREGIDIRHYRFDLTLSDDSDAIQGVATMLVRSTGVSVRKLLLDLATPTAAGTGMTVWAVQAGQDSLAHTHENDLLDITLPRPMHPGDSVFVTVVYGGVPGGGLRIGPNRWGERTFFSDNWPNRARQWLPTIDHPYDKATVEFVVTHPAHYQVVSNGFMIEETDVMEGTRITHWREGVPIAPWLFTLGVARFAMMWVGEHQGTPLQTWVYAQDRDQGAALFQGVTLDAMRFFASTVGPFAYEKLANIQSPATPGGMEAATAIMYNESAVGSDDERRWRHVIIHEVAHQWFGNSVTESDWDDVWLSEGFATYYTLLYRENRYGRADFEEGLDSAAARVWRRYEDHPDERIVHDDLTDMSRVTSVVTYQKGAWVLHMLRKRIGDVAFRVGIRRYYRTHMNGHATTADFRHVMERVSGQDLETFFEQWLYSGGNPELEGRWRYDAAAGAVVVELEQVQRTGPTFDLTLDVGLRFAGQRRLRIETLEMTERRQSFSLTVPGEPTEVVLDPERWTLFRADFGPAGP